MAKITLVKDTQQLYTATADCLIQNTTDFNIGFNTDGSNDYCILPPINAISIVNGSGVYLISTETAEDVDLVVTDYNYGGV